MILACLLILLTRPEPIQINNLLSSEECTQVIADATFSPSATIGGKNELRTSETAWLPKDHPVARKVLLKVCQLTGKSIDNCEDLQIVRYSPGTYYRPHQDSCCDDTAECQTFLKDRGQRIGTLLVYLNDDFTEGETDFPNLKRRYKPKPGSGIFWNPRGCPPEALHAGLPVASGAKYVCNAWVREL